MLLPRKEKRIWSPLYSLLFLIPFAFSFALYVFGLCSYKNLSKTSANTEIFTPKHFTHLLSLCAPVVFARCFTVYLHTTVLVGKLWSRLRALLFTEALGGNFSSLTAYIAKIICLSVRQVSDLLSFLITHLSSKCYVVKPGHLLPHVQPKTFMLNVFYF